MDSVVVYTDGSGVNNPKLPHWGHGGCGLLMSYKKNKAEHLFGSFRNTTSARMEILPIIKSLDLCKPGFDIKIYTDNQYCKNTITNKWYEDWLAHKTDKKNLDLWLRFKKIHDHHISNGSTITVGWVRGHNGNPKNVRADKLANEARNKSEVIVDDKIGIYLV